MSEGPRDTYAEFMRNTEAYKDCITAVRGRSEDVAKDFKESIDLLFIDGDHSYEICRKDASLWIPLMRNGGTVIFHDTGWAEGVRRAGE